MENCTNFPPSCFSVRKGAPIILMRKSISIVTVAATAMTLTPAIVAMAAASSSSTSDSSSSPETQVSFCRVDGQ